jgi:hypothetical protein
MLMPHYFTSINWLHEAESRFAGLQNKSVERLALMLSTRQGQTSNLETDISAGLQTVNPAYNNSTYSILVRLALARSIGWFSFDLLQSEPRN